MKANHNKEKNGQGRDVVVSNGSKILKWKQITTNGVITIFRSELFLMVQRY